MRQASPYSNRQRSGAQTSNSVGSNPTGGTKSVVRLFQNRAVHPPELRARARAPPRSRTQHSRSRSHALPALSRRSGTGAVDRPSREASGTELGASAAGPDVENPTEPAAYAYLLGLYLGDGHLATSRTGPGAANRLQRPSGRTSSRRATPPCARCSRRSVQRIPKQGCVCDREHGAHWPCLLPQHGPGKKHERPIVLADWQRPISKTTPVTSCVACSTPTAAASPTG